MSKQVNKEQTKAATQEENTELTDEQLVVAAGGSPRELKEPEVDTSVDSSEPATDIEITADDGGELEAKYYPIIIKQARIVDL